MLDAEPRTSHDPLQRMLRAGHPGGSEVSLIELVLLACDVSEDPGEVNDLVDCAIDSGAARLLPAACDPMMGCLDFSPSSERAA